MTGIFNVPSQGLSNVSLDEILAHIKENRNPTAALSELQRNNSASSSVLKRLAHLADPDVLSICGDDGLPILKSDLERDAAEKLIDIFSRIPDGPRRRKLLGRLRASIERDGRNTKAERLKVDAMIVRLRAYQAATIDINSWIVTTAARFGKPSASALHKFRDALREKMVYDPMMFGSGEVPGELPSTETAAWLEVTAEATVLVIEHDWAAAFRGASDFEGGETRLPAEFCVFESVVNGKHVLSFATQDAWPSLQHAIRAENDLWVLFNPEADRDDDLLKSISAQVRAVVIALDAEVAVTETVRAPHKLNRAREARGKLPLFDYHVVSLARRARAAALPAADGGEPGQRRRLHFRRGHWRHYQDHKTWIRWMLVGDPDLGFVDKHYRV